MVAEVGHGAAGETATSAATRVGPAEGPADEPRMTWRALDWLERLLTAICGLCLAGFTVATLMDVVTRAIGTPINDLQNIILGLFVWGVFLGACVAQRRREHFRIAALAERFVGVRRQLLETLEQAVVIAVALWMIYYGYLNVLTGLGNLLQPSQVPVSVVTASIPLAGVLLVLFGAERLYHVWKYGSALKPYDSADAAISAGSSV